MCNVVNIQQALLNLGNSDSKLRSSAYNLLCALATAFNLPLEGQLLETKGLFRILFAKL